MRSSKTAMESGFGYLPGTLLVKTLTEYPLTACGGVWVEAGMTSVESTSSSEGKTRTFMGNLHYRVVVACRLTRVGTRTDGLNLFALNAGDDYIQINSRLRCGSGLRGTIVNLVNLQRGPNRFPKGSFYFVSIVSQQAVRHILAAQLARVAICSSARTPQKMVITRREFVVG